MRSGFLPLPAAALAILLASGIAAVGTLALSPAMALAQEVQATFSLPPDHAQTPVSWSATPTDLPEEADVLSAMIMQPDSTPGPWTVTLAPGAYQITAFSEADVFELHVTLPATPAVQSYEVPPIALGAAVAFRCEEAPSCAFVDPETGLAFALPQGWASEAPYRLDPGAGEPASEVSAVFFEDVEGEDAAVWFLNPPDWTEEDYGPCREVAAGALCTFDETPSAVAAFAVIAPALSAPPQSAAPQPGLTP
ncbi:MAG: hypothetical protein MUF74_12055 [Cypionkella sp.]|nr:hypothetical protein [Cypionkella sp.]